MTTDHIGAPGDIVVGAEAIARVLGVKPRAVYHLVATHALPGALRVGGRLAMSRRAYLAAIEAACAASSPRMAA